MAKKISKVKKNNVKSTKRSIKKVKSRVLGQKSKRIKKKAVTAVKKKIVKAVKKKTKTTKKKKTKKKVRRRKSRKISMEDIYKLINEVQIKGEKLTFAVEFEEADVVQNIIKDISVKFSRIEMKTQTLFNLEPSKEATKYQIEIEEYFEDEVPDEDEIDFSLI